MAIGTAIQILPSRQSSARVQIALLVHDAGTGE
jgi:hypothetical protein